MPAPNTIQSWLYLFCNFIITVFAGLQSFNWVTLVGEHTALQIVGGISFLTILAKSWLSTAELMARRMTETK